MTAYVKGFGGRPTAHAYRWHWGRRQKASSEGTRGDVDDPVPQGLWRLMVEGSDWTRPMTARWSAS
jgi:membrane protein implicated in regulation of membrane protease activity